MKNKFKVFKRLKETIDSYRDRLRTEGEPPMNFKETILYWIREKKPWLSIWILFFILTVSLATCSEIEVDLKYKYKTPQVIKNILGNKK